MYYNLVSIPDSKVHGANMGPTWDLSAPDGPHESCYQGCLQNETTWFTTLIADVHAQITIVTCTTENSNAYLVICQQQPRYTPIHPGFVFHLFTTLIDDGSVKKTFLRSTQDVSSQIWSKRVWPQTSQNTRTRVYRQHQTLIIDSVCPIIPRFYWRSWQNSLHWVTAPISLLLPDGCK